jgi:hypothetical protein
VDGEFFDVDDVPVALGWSGAPGFSCAFDSDPPRPFDPASARRNGVPIEFAAFKALVASAGGKLPTAPEKSAPAA